MPDILSRLCVHVWVRCNCVCRRSLQNVRFVASSPSQFVVCQTKNLHHGPQAPPCLSSQEREEGRCADQGMEASSPRMWSKSVSRGTPRVIFVKFTGCAVTQRDIIGAPEGRRLFSFVLCALRQAPPFGEAPQRQEEREEGPEAPPFPPPYGICHPSAAPPVCFVCSRYDMVCSVCISSPGFRFWSLVVVIVESRFGSYRRRSDCWRPMVSYLLPFRSV